VIARRARRLAGYATVFAVLLSWPHAVHAADAKPATAASSAAQDGIPLYATFVKDAVVQDGIFPLIRKDGKVYLTLTTDQLDHDFYEHVTSANGLGGFGILSGDDWQQEVRIVRFERVDAKQIALVFPQELLQAQPGTPASAAIQGSTAASVQAVAPVVAEDKSTGKIAIDAAFLLSDQLDLGNTLTNLETAAQNPLGAYHLDPTRTYFGPTKAFPKNDVIETEQTFESAKPEVIDTVVDPRTVQMRVTYNFAELLSSPDYVPRLADDRIGYWIDTHLNFDNDHTYDNEERYITRWNLRASDPSKPSPAIKPIVYTLSNTIPLEYRQTIRDAILEWNKAFERIGILDAVQVQDQPNDPTFDPDDIRYNTVRWLTEANDSGFLEAQIEWDPRTGEIFRSGVLLDADFVRSVKWEYVDLTSPAEGFPTSLPESGVANSAPLAALWDPTTSGTRRGVSGPGPALHRDLGLERQAQLGALKLALLGEEVPQSYVQDYLRWAVMHESGHDFGLAHNFIGHDAYTAAQLKDKNFTERNGVATSVMGYLPVNLWPKNTSHGDLAQATLGPYDYHVIHWGYAPVPGAKTPEDEVPTLSQWAQAENDPKYRFASDEDVEFDGHAVDPRVSQWILSNDTISWCKTQMGIDRDLLHSLDVRFPRPEMPWDQERAAFGLLVDDYSRCALTMTHYVGGEFLSRARRGDPHAPQPLTPIARSEERRAFANLDEYLFSDAAWQISPATLRRLVYSEYEPVNNFGYVEYPRHDISLPDFVASLQNEALVYMFTPLVLERLADLPSKTETIQPMTTADLFSWTQESVYGDLARGTPDTSSLRHTLQRNYARVLEHLAVTPDPGTPFDAQALARHELVSLAGDIRRTLRRSRLDLETRAHLEALGYEVQSVLQTKTVRSLSG